MLVRGACGGACGTAASAGAKSEKAHAANEVRREAEKLVAALEAQARKAEQVCAKLRAELEGAIGSTAQVSPVTAQPRGGSISVQMDTAAGASCFPKEFANGLQDDASHDSAEEREGRSDRQ